VKETHNELSITKSLSFSFVELIPSGAMIVNSKGHILTSNTLLNTTLNENSGSITGVNIEKFLPSGIKKSHGSLLSSFFNDPTPRKMGPGKKLFAITSVGKEIPVEIGLSPILVEGVGCVLVTLVDISPRLEATALFERSVHVSPHGILIVDRGGKISLANESLCQCLGYAHEDIVGKSVESLLPERYRGHHKVLRDTYWEEPTVKMMGVGRDLTALHADGREFPVEIGLSPLNDKNENVLVTLTDITQRKKLELELQESNKNLEEFTYVASHDLRSPLRGISDLVDWVKEDLGDNLHGDVEKNIDRISVRINKMETLIENLLTYAKSGKEGSKIEMMLVSDLVDDTLSFLNIPENFKIECDLSESQFLGFRTPVETVLRNLISNAVKHHDKTFGNITISACYENSMIRLSVEDDGPGIPVSAISRIFRLFQTATSSVHNSSGIGLSVSRRLTETHGGKIEVENTGNGAVFHVWWPRFVRRDNHD